MTVREQIIIAARRNDADIGDEAMITAMEHGWWVAGAICVRKLKPDSSDSKGRVTRRGCDDNRIFPVLPDVQRLRRGSKEDGV
jgi:hypothetical protein